jgi:uncharacterized membrane protein
MQTKIICSEIKEGVKSTSKYILSHHQPHEYYKCYHCSFFGRNVFFCSRCLGIYIGIILGFILLPLNLFTQKEYYLIISIFPMFTLIDWSISAFKLHKSHNLIRTFIGILLGIAYILALKGFFQTFPNYKLILIGIIYTILSICLLYAKHSINFKK